MKLGLVDWTLSFRTERDDGVRYAHVAYDTDARQATITVFVRKSTRDTLAPERIALHEMLHVLFADMLAVTAARASDTHAEVGREEHKVIERLLNAMEGRP